MMDPIVAPWGMAGPRGRVYVVYGVEEIDAAEFQEVIVDLRKFLPFSL